MLVVQVRSFVIVSGSRWVILDAFIQSEIRLYIFFCQNGAGDRQSAWTLGGVGSFFAGELFCISYRE